MGVRRLRIELLQKILGGKNEEEVDNGGDEDEVDDGGEELAVLE